MGQRLSCVQKKASKEDNQIKKGKPNKKTKESKLISDDGIDAVSSAVTQNAHVDGENRVRNKIKRLPSAPSEFKLPKAAPLHNQGKESNLLPKIDEKSIKSSNDIANTYAKEHYLHPTDGPARQLVYEGTKPDCWKDLYWHIIGSRNLTRDEDKVRALFTWLCSKPPSQIPFANFEDSPQVSLSKDSKTNDAPDVVLTKLALGTAPYVQAFESLCRYSGIPCSIIRGIAKSVEYKVGQELMTAEKPLFNPETGALQPQITSLQHSWNAAYIDDKWCLFDCAWAAHRLAIGGTEPTARISQASEAMKLQYETDMFYFQSDPTELIYTHYPFQDEWQLLKPPVSVVKFATWPLLKPAFFQYGLSLFSHQEGTIYVEDKFVLKLRISQENVQKLMFTYSLNLEGLGNIDAGCNLTRFGIHECSMEEASVIFRFRLPKTGKYNLILYARRSGEQIFSDVCEYLVIADGKKSSEKLSILPFPPTAQANYGPTEKASEIGIETLPRQLNPLITTKTGSVELRFIASESGAPLPHLTARLKSLTIKAEEMQDCILSREIEASIPNTGTSILTATGPCVAMFAITAYLPAAGEYALEVYGASSSEKEPESYTLVWQFLIEAETGKHLSKALLKHLSVMNLGHQDSDWKDYGFRTLSHPDPIIRVRTTGYSATEMVFKKGGSKMQLLERYIKASVDAEHRESKVINTEEDVDNTITTEQTEDIPKLEEEIYDRESADFAITISVPIKENFSLTTQFVDISEEEEKEVNYYVLRKDHEIDDQFEDTLLDQIRGRGIDENMIEAGNRLMTILIRIPKGGVFYKLYLYANVTPDLPYGLIPLLFTYLIDAPHRMKAAEAPYIGAVAGEFPEHIERIKELESKKLQTE